MAKVEITLLEPRASGWLALAKPLRKVKEGEVIVFSDRLSATVAEKGETDLRLEFNLTGDDFDAALAEAGQMPLPPYIASRRPVDARDADDYQTIFARADGAVAAPTASLHFTPDLVAALDAKPRRISPKYFYDAAGSRLFDRICALPEYYPTRRETAILRARSAEIASTIEVASRLVEIAPSMPARMPRSRLS